MKHHITWYNVLKDSAGSNHIKPNHPYLILGAQTATGVIDLDSNTILTSVGNTKYLDLLSAESDYFTRLLCFMQGEFNQGNLRNDSSYVGAYVAIQVIEYPELSPKK